MQPGHHHLGDVLGRDAGVVEGQLPRLLCPARHSAARRIAPPTAWSADRPVCATGRGTPRSPTRPRGVRPAPVRRRCLRPRGARRPRHRPRARRRSSAGPCASRTTRPAAGSDPPSAARKAPTPDRTDPERVERGRVAVEAQRGVHDGRVGLVEVGRRRRREPDGARQSAATVAERTQREPSRLDTHGGGVLVVGRHRATSLAGVGTRRLADGAALQPVVRHVAGESQDPLHPRQSRALNLTPRQGPGGPRRPAPRSSRFDVRAAGRCKPIAGVISGQRARRCRAYLPSGDGR